LAAREEPSQRTVQLLAGAKIVSEPEDKPWRLRELRVADLDDNQFRVLYDFSAGLQHEQA
jgi:hypothetical protein